MVVVVEGESFELKQYFLPRLAEVELSPPHIDVICKKYTLCLSPPWLKQLMHISVLSPGTGEGGGQKQGRSDVGY